MAGPTLIQGIVFTNYAQMDVARRISIASAGADSAIIFTVNGFNRDLQPIGQTVTGVAVGTPVATTLDFLIVTQVTVSGATAGAITVGTNTTGSTSWVKTSTDMNNWALSAAGVVVSGSANYQIEHTYDDPNGGPGNTSYFSLSDSSDVMPNAAQPPFVFLTGTAQTNTNYEVQYANQPITAQRLTITSGTGLVAFYSVQSGLRS